MKNRWDKTFYLLGTLIIVAGLLAPFIDLEEIAAQASTPVVEESDAPDSTSPEITVDSDGDGISDTEESETGTNPNLTDTDGDSLSDLAEKNIGSDPLDPKSPNLVREPLSPVDPTEIVAACNNNRETTPDLVLNQDRPSEIAYRITPAGPWTSGQTVTITATLLNTVEYDWKAVLPDRWMIDEATGEVFRQFTFTDIDCSAPAEIDDPQSADSPSTPGANKESDQTTESTPSPKGSDHVESGQSNEDLTGTPADEVIQTDDTVPAGTPEAADTGASESTALGTPIVAESASRNALASQSTPVVSTPIAMETGTVATPVAARLLNSEMSTLSDSVDGGENCNGFLTIFLCPNLNNQGDLSVNVEEEPWLTSGEQQVVTITLTSDGGDGESEVSFTYAQKESGTHYNQAFGAVAIENPADWECETRLVGAVSYYSCSGPMQNDGEAVIRLQTNRGMYPGVPDSYRCGSYYSVVTAHFVDGEVLSGTGPNVNMLCSDESWTSLSVEPNSPDARFGLGYYWIPAGSDLSFKVTATNLGPGTEEDLQLKVTQPHFFDDRWTSDQPGCTWDHSGTFSMCDFGELGSGDSISFDVYAATDENSCGMYSLSVESPNTGNGSATSIPINVQCNAGQADVSVQAITSHELKGDPGYFVVLVSDHSSNASFKRFGLTVDLTSISNGGDGVYVVKQDGIGNCTIDDSTMTCSGNFGLFSNVPRSVVIEATSWTGCGGTIQADASLRVDGTTPWDHPDPVTAWTSFDVWCDTNIDIEFACPDTSGLVPGDTLVVPVTVSNSGNVPLTNAKYIPSNGGQMSGDTPETVIGLSSHESFLTVTVTDENLNADEIPISLDVRSQPEDVIIIDDGSTWQQSVKCDYSRHANLTISATLGDSTIGDQTSATYILSNDGNARVNGAGFQADLPDTSSTWILTSDANDACALTQLSSGEYQMNCEGLQLGSHGSVTITAISQFTPGTCGDHETTATITNRGSGTATASTEVPCPDLEIIVDSDQDSISSGESALYTVTVTNHSTTSEDDVEFMAQLPMISLGGNDGIFWTIGEPSISPGSCVLNRSTFICSGFELASGESVELPLYAQSLSGACDEISVSAKLTYPEEITSEAVTTDIQCATNPVQVNITNVVNDQDLSTGDTIELSMNVSHQDANHKGEIAENVAFTNDLPDVGRNWIVSSQGYSATGDDNNCGIIKNSAGGQSLHCANINLTYDSDAYFVTVSTEIQTTIAPSMCHGIVDNYAQLIGGYAGFAKTNFQIICGGLGQYVSIVPLRPTVNAGESITYVVRIVDTGTIRNESYNYQTTVTAPPEFHESDPEALSWLSVTSDDSGEFFSCYKNGGANNDKVDCGESIDIPNTGDLTVTRTYIVTSVPVPTSACGKTLAATAESRRDNGSAIGASTNVQVECESDLNVQVSSASGVTNVASGNDIGFEFRLENNGGPASDAHFHAQLPDTGSTWEIVQGADACELTGNDLNCTGIDLTAWDQDGNSFEAQVKSATNENSCGDVYWAFADITYSYQSARASITMTCSPLSVVLECADISSTDKAIESEVQYNLSITNDGLSDFSSLLVDPQRDGTFDPPLGSLPAGDTYIGTFTTTLTWQDAQGGNMQPIFTVTGSDENYRTSVTSLPDCIYQFATDYTATGVCTSVADGTGKGSMYGMRLDFENTGDAPIRDLMAGATDSTSSPHMVNLIANEDSAQIMVYSKVTDVDVAAKSINRVIPYHFMVNGSEVTGDVTVNCSFEPAARSEVSILTVASADNIAPGDSIAFTVLVSNNKETEASGISFSIDLPAGNGIAWTVDTTTFENQCTLNGNTVTCSDVSLGASGDLTSSGAIRLGSATDFSPSEEICTNGYTATAKLTGTFSGESSATIALADCLKAKLPSITLTEAACVDNSVTMAELKIGSDGEGISGEVNPPSPHAGERTFSYHVTLTLKPGYIWPTDMAHWRIDGNTATRTYVADGATCDVSVTLTISSSDPAAAAMMPSGSSWLVTNVADGSIVSEGTFDDDELELPTFITLWPPFAPGVYRFEISATPLFEPYSQEFEVSNGSTMQLSVPTLSINGANSNPTVLAANLTHPAQTIEIVLQVAGDNGDGGDSDTPDGGDGSDSGTPDDGDGGDSGTPDDGDGGDSGTPDDGDGGDSGKPDDGDGGDSGTPDDGDGGDSGTPANDGDDADGNGPSTQPSTTPQSGTDSVTGLPITGTAGGEGRPHTGQLLSLIAASVLLAGATAIRKMRR